MVALLMVAKVLIMVIVVLMMVTKVMMIPDCYGSVVDSC